MTSTLPVLNRFRTWQSRVETRRALSRLHSEHLLEDIGYTRDMAEAEIDRWFFQPLLNDHEANTPVERLAGHKPLREQRRDNGLAPILFPARS